MPEPIDYQVLLNLQTALQAITTAGGYHHTVAATAVKLDPNQNVQALIAPGGPRPFIVIEMKPERREYQPSRRVQIVLPWTVHVVHDADVTSDVSRARTHARASADVEQAVAVDLTRGGRAIDTRVITSELGGTDGEEVWTMVDLEIALIRTYGSPNG